MEIFLREEAPIESHHPEHFRDRCFILTLAYLADIFTVLNLLNISMQGAGITFVKV